VYSCNIRSLRNSITNIVPEIWDVVRKLRGETRKKLAGMANVSATSREEKTGSESFFFKVSAGNSARDRGLPRPCETRQPEDEMLVMSISPAVDSVE
jgi:hypothetical protein